MEHKRHKKVARLIKRKQRRLANLINYTLVKSYAVTEPTDRMRYYQGYHDIACIFLSSLGGSVKTSPSTSYSSSTSNMEPLAASMGLQVPAGVLLQVSQSHLRDCLKANFSSLQVCLRLTLFPLLALMDPPVHDHLAACQMEPFFALSWVITWFSHDVRDTELVKRLFDAFIVSHPLMPIYVSIAMVTHEINRQEILRTECDFSLLHSALTGLPRNSSMVGWKFRPGDGYVSDDEEDDDDDSVASDNMEADFLLVQSELDKSMGNKVPGEAGTTVSSVLTGNLDPPVRVPFQDLFDSAIRIMKRIPPHRLHALAGRYYGKAAVQEMEVEDMHFFERIPSWAISPSAKADWVLKQQARSRRGSPLKSRRDRRRANSLTRDQKSQLPSDIISRTADEEEKLALMVLKENAKSTAAIAAGFGKGDDDMRRRRRRRRVFLFGAIAVTIVAVAVGVALQYGQKRKQVKDNVPPRRQPSRRSATHRGAPIDRVEASGRTVYVERVEVASTPLLDPLSKSAGVPGPTKNMRRSQSSTSERPVWNHMKEVGKVVGGTMHKAIDDTSDSDNVITGNTKTTAAPTWLAVCSAVQARASSEVSKLGGRIEGMCKKLEPRARRLISEVQQKSGEISRLSLRFLLRGDHDAIVVPEAKVPSLLSLHSRGQRRIHQEVSRLGDLLGLALKPQLEKARGAINSETADKIRGALKTLSPLVDRLNQPYGDQTDEEPDL